MKQIYTRIESLTSVAFLKALRSAEIFINRKDLLQVKYPKGYVILPPEDKHDQIAYSDSINRKFVLYYNLTIQYLKQYLK